MTETVGELSKRLADMADRCEKLIKEKESLFDCTFLYFKPKGKWKYEGRGIFPVNPEPGKYCSFDREVFFTQNGGWPGINGDADDLTVVVIPDEDCDKEAAWPRMFVAAESL